MMSLFPIDLDFSFVVVGGDEVVLEVFASAISFDNMSDLRFFFDHCFPARFIAHASVSTHELYSTLSAAKNVYVFRELTGDKLNWKSFLALVRNFNFESNPIFKFIPLH